MADKKTARRTPASFSVMDNHHGLFSAGMTLSPVTWESLLPGASRGQQTAFNFDEQSTRQWRPHPDDDGGNSIEGVHRSLDRQKRRTKRTKSGRRDTTEKVITVRAERKKLTCDDSVEVVAVQRRYRSIDEAQRQFKERVIRKLLAEFSLDKTYRKYRSLSAQSYKINPADFSFDCALSAQRLRDRLQRMTNSDVITINDRQFTDHICQLLDEQQKEEIEQAENRRAQEEVSRLRRLMHNGVITADELQSELAAIGATAAGAVPVCKRTASSSKRTSSCYSSRRHTLTDKSDHRLPSINHGELSAVQLRIRSTSSAASSRHTDQPAVHSDVHVGQHDVSRLSGTTNVGHVECQPGVVVAVQSNASNGKCSTTQYRSESSCNSGADGKAITTTYQPPLMKSLRETQKLGEMYCLADRLLYGRQLRRGLK